MQLRKHNHSQLSYNYNWEAVMTLTQLSSAQPTLLSPRIGTGAAMPPMAAAAAFLVLEFVAGNGRIPHAVFSALLASLPPPPTVSSPRLRKAIALRALNSALHSDDAASTALLLLRKARVVLADPYITDCFPQLLPFSLPDHKYDDEVTAAATIADLKRILDREWASLPPSTLELTADRIVGTWARAEGSNRRKLRLLVGGSIEREIVAKHGQDAYASRPLLAPDVDKSANAPDRIGANETYHAQAQGDGQAELSKGKNNEAECAQEEHAQPQQKSVNGAVKGKVCDNPQVIDKSTASHVITALDNAQSQHVVAAKRSLMVRDPTATTYKWDGSGHSDDESPYRLLPPFEKRLKPCTASQKTKKKWSEIQEKTLLEGIEKYGKGNWKDIKMAYPFVFEDRSTVDLKDKFRNLERYQTV